MLERPNLRDEKIIACLRESYGIEVAGFEFLPIGNDSATWVYRGWTADKQSYFVKVRRGAPYPPSVSIPRFLKDEGMEGIIAPLPTGDGALWCGLGEFTVFVYPFVKGRSGMAGGLSDEQWVAYGAAVRRIHETRLTAGLAGQLPKETFVPNVKYSGILKRLQGEVLEREYVSPAERELAAFWRDKWGEIGAMMARAEELGQVLQEQLQRQAFPFVLCHADIHVANLLLDEAGKLFVVDWDQPMLAPKERDLVYILGASIGKVVTGPKEEELFLRGYGDRVINALAMAYYRYEWVVQDIGAYGESVFFMEELSEESKQGAAEGLFVLFRPGSSVELARRSERKLLP